MDENTTTKDLKVRLPAHYHVKLQTLKVLKGQNMSETFCEALEMYFQEKGHDKETLAQLQAMLV